MSCTACSAWPLEPDNSQARQCESALMPCTYANLGPVIMSGACCRANHTARPQAGHLTGAVSSYHTLQ